ERRDELVRLPGQLPQPAAGAGVPQPDDAVIAAGGEHGPVRVELHRRDLPAVPAQHVPDLTGRGVPQPGGPVVAAGRQLPAVRPPGRNTAGQSELRLWVNWCCNCPVAESHSRTPPSLSQVASTAPSGPNVPQYSAPVCPISRARRRPVAVSHRYTVPSVSPLA